MSWKSLPFPQTKRFSFTESFTFCLKSLSFLQPKHCSFERLFTALKNRLFTYKKPFICTNLSLFLSKATFFHPPSPIRTTLNLLFAKNAAVLLLFALILCCKTGTSHRFKSLPAIPGKLQLSALPVTWWLPVVLAKTAVRLAIWIAPGVQRFANLWCTFGSFRTSEKN